jgi:hypothetical protein
VFCGILASFFNILTMLKSLSLNKLLWIDCSAAFVAGLFLLVFKSKLAPFFNVTEDLLTNLMCIAFTFGCYSFYLANQKINAQKMLNILVLGNSLYSVFCLGILFSNYKTANVFGVGYFLFDALVVGFLAFLEWEKIQSQV